eukprot:7991396-Alexandrium_andersonii.AAC.1
MAPERFSGGFGGTVAPPGRERRKLLETAQNCWTPLEPAGSVEDPSLRTRRCRPNPAHKSHSPRP